jgi:hypothetical protein
LTTNNRITSPQDTQSEGDAIRIPNSGGSPFDAYPAPKEGTNCDTDASHRCGSTGGVSDTAVTVNSNGSIDIPFGLGTPPQPLYVKLIGVASNESNVYTSAQPRAQVQGLSLDVNCYYGVIPTTGCAFTPSP